MCFLKPEIQFEQYCNLLFQPIKLQRYKILHEQCRCQASLPYKNGTKNGKICPDHDEKQSMCKTIHTISVDGKKSSRLDWVFVTFRPIQANPASIILVSAGIFCIDQFWQVGGNQAQRHEGPSLGFGLHSDLSSLLSVDLSTPLGSFSVERLAARGMNVHMCSNWLKILRNNSLSVNFVPRVIFMWLWF